MRNRRTNYKSGAISAIDDQVAIPCKDASGVLLQIFATAVSARFLVEASMDSTNGTDGTWVRLAISSTVATNRYTQTADTGSLTAEPTNGWIARVVPFRWVRVRCISWSYGNSVRAALTAFAGAI